MGVQATDLGLLERGRELESAAGAVAAAAAGRGGLVVVQGPAGIGKSALLAAVRESAAGAGMRVLRARGAELEHDFAFGVARQAFERALAEAGERERARALEGAAALAGRLLGLPGADAADPGPATAGPDPSFAVLHGLYWLCANLAAERPLCLVVDDAHWADAPSLRFLAFLAPRVEELRVAVVVAARPGEPGPGADLVAALAADPAAVVVSPAPLSGPGVARLLADGLGAEPDARFAGACHRATGGNPFLVGQLLTSLREDEVAPTAEAAAHVEGLGARWVGRWILTRLGRLPPAAGRLARAVAVLEEGEVLDAAALAGLEFDEAGDAADVLAAAGILEPGRPLAFVHPIVRAGIYAEIGSAERARGHGRAARLLEDAGASPERVVEHLLASEPAGDPWAVERLAGAARAAACSGAPESAAVFLSRALAEPPAPELRSGLLLELGVAQDNSGRPGARESLEAAIAAARDPRARAAAAVVLGHALARDNRFAEALAVLDSAGGDGPDGDWPPVEDLAASIATFSVATAEAHAARIGAARERGDPAASPTREQLALAGQLAVRANEPAADAAARALRALDAGPSPFPLLTDLPWLHQAAVTLLWSERDEELQALLEGAVATAGATGDAGLYSGALAYRGWLALRRGDLEAAEADTRTALDAASLPAPAMYRMRSTAVLVEALVERGALDEAEAALAPAHETAGEPTTIGAGLRLARGRLRLEQDRADEALVDFREAGDIATRTGLACPSCLPWRSEAALALARLGRGEPAAGLADEELGLARAFGAPRTLGVALRVAGVVRGGAPGEVLLREALEALEPSGARLERARAQVDLGAHLRRGNRRAEARRVLGPALDAAHRMGARPLAERAETELRATGARPRRVLLTGVESLTASERRVAELAARGLTNREIAQALFVTARTVEGHLTHVFQKLALSSRDDLPAALAA